MWAERAFGTVVRMLLETLASRIAVPGVESWLCFLFELPACVHPARQRWWLRCHPHERSGWSSGFGLAVVVVGIWGTEPVDEDRSLPFK